LGSDEFSGNIPVKSGATHGEVFISLVTLPKYFIWDM
jgi:hypothetical protein